VRVCVAENWDSIIAVNVISCHSATWFIRLYRQ